jgi:iron complex outermembrane receptor protein
VILLGYGYAGAASASPLELSEIEDVEELSLGELLERPVVAASRYETKPGDSPTLVSSVDRELIDRLGYRSVGEALRGMRGVYLSNDRNYSYIGARGLSVPGDYNTRFALSIDGHGINDAVYQQASAGTELGVPMIAIDHIEMLRGGAWSVYGESALLGAIEVVTASGATRPGLRVSATTRAGLETTSDPAGRATVAPRGQDVSASYGAVTRGLDIFAAASYLFDAGLGSIYTADFDDPSLACVNHSYRARPCDGIVHGNDGDAVGSAYVVLRSRELAIHALAARRRKRVPTATYESLIDAPGNQTYDDRIYADAEYKASGKRSDVIGRIAGDYYGYAGDYPYDLPRPGAEALPDSFVINKDLVSGLWFSGELRGRYKIPRLGRHVSDVEIGAGAELGLGYAEQKNFDALPEGDDVLLDSSVRSRMAAVTAQASVRVVDRLVGFAAIRADYHPDSFGRAINPQGGIVLDGGELGRVRASLARGFRAPNAYERYYVASDQEINTELGPERSETRELSLERYLGKHVRTQLVGYSQHMTDLIVLTPRDNGLRAFVNQNSMRVRGVEAELEARWNEIRVRASYAWQTSMDQDGARLVNSPRSVAYGSLLAPILRGRLDFAVETYYVGARLSSVGSSVPASLVTNLSITARQVVDQLDITLGATNLFDQRGSDPGSEDHRQGTIPHDPRVIWLRLQLELGD